MKKLSGSEIKILRRIDQVNNLDNRDAIDDDIIEVLNENNLKDVISDTKSIWKLLWNEYIIGNRKTKGYRITDKGKNILKEN